MKKAIAIAALGVGLMATACSPQFDDLEGVEGQDPDHVIILRNVDGFPNINIVCLNGDALIMRSTKYDDMMIQHVPDSENQLCP